MTKHTQIRIVWVVMLIATLAGTLHVASYKLTPMRVMALWFPFGVIADRLLRFLPLSVLIGLLQYPLFALAFAAGVRRLPTAVVLAVVAGIYIGAVCIAFAISRQL